MSFYGYGILNGMRIAMRNMFRGPITVKYPHEKVELPERARWAVQLKLDEDGAHKCTGCLACEKACPDFIIKIDVTTAEDRSKHIDLWDYQLGACMMCGLCVEACPFDAIEMGHDYELASRDVGSLEYALITDEPAAKPKRKTAPASQGAARATAQAPAPAGEQAVPAIAEAVAPATPVIPEGEAESD